MKPLKDFSYSELLIFFIELALAKKESIKSSEYILLTLFYKQDNLKYEYIRDKLLLYYEETNLYKICEALLESVVAKNLLSRIEEENTKKNVYRYTKNPHTQNILENIKKEANDTYNLLIELFKHKDIEETFIFNYVFSFTLQEDIESLSIFNIKKNETTIDYKITNTIKTQGKINEAFEYLSYGAIFIWSSICRKVELKQANNVVLFFDLPIVFSILNMHSIYDNNVANNMVELLDKHGFQMKVSGFTNAMFIDRLQYTKTIFSHKLDYQIGDIDDILYRQGKTRTEDIQRIINRFKEWLDNKKINVLEGTHKVAFDKFKLPYHYDKYTYASYATAETIYPHYNNTSQNLYSAKQLYVTTNGGILIQASKLNKRPFYIPVAISPTYIILHLFYEEVMDNTSLLNIILSNKEREISTELNIIYQKIITDAESHFKFNTDELNTIDEFHARVSVVKQLPDDSPEKCDIEQKMLKTNPDITQIAQTIYNIEITLQGKQSDLDIKERDLDNKIKEQDDLIETKARETIQLYEDGIQETINTYNIEKTQLINCLKSLKFLSKKEQNCINLKKIAFMLIQGFLVLFFIIAVPLIILFVLQSLNKSAYNELLEKYTFLETLDPYLIYITIATSILSTPAISVILSMLLPQSIKRNIFEYISVKIKKYNKKLDNNKKNILSKQTKEQRINELDNIIRDLEEIQNNKSSS